MSLEIQGSGSKGSGAKKSVDVKEKEGKLMQHSLKHIEDASKKDEEDFKPTGKKILMAETLKHPRNLSKLEAKALKLLKNGAPCLYQRYIYLGERQVRRSDKPTKTHEDAIFIKEVTPIDVGDLEKKGYVKKEITHHIPKEAALPPWEALPPSKRMSEEQFNFMLLDDAILSISGIHISGDTEIRENSTMKGGVEKYIEDFRHETDQQFQRIVSNCQIIKKNDGSYDVVLTVYLKPEKPF